ncbi:MULTISPECIES: universal stress protein [unclassified Rhizobium]|uniref:universal stress protein n=1 Tax=unclassified Rhizobium TaxID=2613769 RepID=UPI0016177F4B|nr:MULTISPECIES: universal stress protein [unclassified Rhizobium]MBB3545161.1 nucleotide-binding universal stress UspA family protein [Rhizobium sp. BK399]MCS3743575.1 nucleotide-binding universal stress UspA family protein [Rhizobium sp. BK661]MCS4096539.1 nucleotide-binding universal stress UspA family protein [Rhizobium sp. BK176]
MSINTVMCVFSVDEWETDVKTAIEFCETQGAHLNAVVICMCAVPPVAVYPVTTTWLDEQQKEIDRLSEAATAIREVLERSDLSFDIQEIYTEFAWADHDIAQHALYADIILVGPEAAGNAALQRRIIDGALFQSPTPILLNPRRQAVSSFPSSVLLAWDSSDEAARATRQSMEFLKGCEAVHVTMVDPVARRYANGEEPGVEIATFLSRHGIKAEVDRIASGHLSVDTALRQHAVDVGADMVVMGAYNHPRLKQRLFGGVTRSMLKSCPVPLFLAR